MCKHCVNCVKEEFRETHTGYSGALAHLERTLTERSNRVLICANANQLVFLMVLEELCEIK